MLGVLLAFGCSAQPANQGQEQRSPGQQGPKVLIWAGLREPAGFEAVIGLGGSGSPASELTAIVHNFLTIQTDRLDYVPQLAAEAPAVDKGTWQLNPDGSMDTTWKLRPNIKWHDGRPFTSADLMFTFAASIDPDLPKSASASGGIPFMQSASAPDPTTFVIHWSTTYVKANRDAGLGPLPAHILGDRYGADRTELLTDPYIVSEFVGLGAYKLVKWEPGAHVQFARFDDYYAGRPRFDGVVLRFIGDPNVMLAETMAGTVDIASPFLTASLDSVFELKERWAGTRNVVRIDPTDGIRHYQLQFRPELSRPVDGMTNVSVRQALFHAIDRQAIVEVMTHGVAPIADSWVNPRDSLRPDVESAIPPFAYDPGRATQLLAQAGWVRGGDGSLVRQATADRFDIDIWGRPGSATEQELNLTADNWKALGVHSNVYMIPTARVTDRELLATYAGVLLHNPTYETIYEDRIYGKAIAGPSNRWSGRNAAGYVNAKVDPLVEALLKTIEPTPRVQLQRELLHEAMTDVAFMPLYWVVRPVLVSGSVRGTVSAFGTGWNIFDWDKE